MRCIDCSHASRRDARGRGPRPDHPERVGILARAARRIAILAGRGLDSARTIVQRDLQFSDRFTVSQLDTTTGRLSAPLDSGSVRAMSGAGLSWIAELEAVAGGVTLKLWDAATGALRQQGAYPADVGGVGDSRLTIHRLSDQIVNWTGGTGISATRLAFKMKNGTEDAIWRVDIDGANLTRVSRSGQTVAFTPAWSPDGSTIAYSEYRDGRKILYLQKLATGTRTAVTSMGKGDLRTARTSRRMEPTCGVHLCS